MPEFGLFLGTPVWNDTRLSSNRPVKASGCVYALPERIGNLLNHV